MGTQSLDIADVARGEGAQSVIAAAGLLLDAKTGGKRQPVTASRKALSDKPSIAVLPFSADRSDDLGWQFADGLVDDITTALSRVGGLFVIARASSAALFEETRNPGEIGQRLGVRYTVVGGVRRSGSHLRVNAQLVEATSGKQVWADRYDCEITEIFEVQDAISASVCASTQTQITLNEGDRHSTGDTVDIWLLSKRAWRRVYALTPSAVDEGVSLAERAVALSPMSAVANEALAVGLIHQVIIRSDVDRPSTIERARRHALPR